MSTVGSTDVVGYVKGPIFAHLDAPHQGSTDVVGYVKGPIFALLDAPHQFII